MNAPDTSQKKRKGTSIKDPVEEDKKRIEDDNEYKNMRDTANKAAWTFASQHLGWARVSSNTELHDKWSYEHRVYERAGKGTKGTHGEEALRVAMKREWIMNMAYQEFKKGIAPKDGRFLQGIDENTLDIHSKEFKEWNNLQPVSFCKKCGQGAELHKKRTAYAKAQANELARRAEPPKEHIPDIRTRGYKVPPIRDLRRANTSSVKAAGTSLDLQNTRVTKTESPGPIEVAQMRLHQVPISMPQIKRTADGGFVGAVDHPNGDPEISDFDAFRNWYGRSASSQQASFIEEFEKAADKFTTSFGDIVGVLKRENGEEDEDTETGAEKKKKAKMWSADWVAERARTRVNRAFAESNLQEFLTPVPGKTDKMLPIDVLAAYVEMRHSQVQELAKDHRAHSKSQASEADNAASNADETEFQVFEDKQKDLRLAVTNAQDQALEDDQRLCDAAKKYVAQGNQESQESAAATGAYRDASRRAIASKLKLDIARSDLADLEELVPKNTTGLASLHASEEARKPVHKTSAMKALIIALDPNRERSFDKESNPSEDGPSDDVVLKPIKQETISSGQLGFSSVTMDLLTEANDLVKSRRSTVSATNVANILVGMHVSSLPMDISGRSKKSKLAKPSTEGTGEPSTENPEGTGEAMEVEAAQVVDTGVQWPPKKLFNIDSAQESQAIKDGLTQGVPLRDVAKNTTGSTRGNQLVNSAYILAVHKWVDYASISGNLIIERTSLADKADRFILRLKGKVGEGWLSDTNESIWDHINAYLPQWQLKQEAIDGSMRLVDIARKTMSDLVKIDDEGKPIIASQFVHNLVTNLMTLYQHKGQEVLVDRVAEIVSQFIDDPMYTTNNFVTNMRLLGPPGSGKTSISKKIAAVFRSCGMYLTTDFEEAGRANLVASYLGQTVHKTNSFLSFHREGVVFIDEAYSIMHGANDEYGREALTAIVQYVDQNKGRQCLIVAGYEDKMRTNFTDRNPGLTRRFPTRVVMNNLSAQSLFKIFWSQLQVFTEGTEKGPLSLYTANSYKLLQEFLYRALMPNAIPCDDDAGAPSGAALLFEAQGADMEILAQLVVRAATSAWYRLAEGERNLRPPHEPCVMARAIYDYTVDKLPSSKDRLYVEQFLTQQADPRWRCSKMTKMCRGEAVDFGDPCGEETLRSEIETGSAEHAERILQDFASYIEMNGEGEGGAEEQELVS